jgi:hypothetical protein
MSRRFRIQGGIGLLVCLALASCSSSSTNDNQPPPDGGTGTFEPDSGTPPPPPPPVSECKPATGAGTKHEANVTSNETWTADGSPHIVTHDITVRDGGKLTLEPCAEVRVAKGASINVATVPNPGEGTLLAEGSATRPITIKRLDADPWGSLFVMTNGKVTLRYVTLEGGGSDNPGLVVRGRAALPIAKDVLVDHVTIKGAKGYGASLYEGSAFAPGSTDLEISGSGKEPLRVGEHALDTLPKGKYTGNASDAIRIIMDAVQPYAGLQETGTMHMLGVPYIFGELGNETFRVEENSATKAKTTLTIEAGVTVKFMKGTRLEVNHFTSDQPAGGALVALGTDAQRITFTSAEPAPARGDWAGLWFGAVPLATNKLDHVVIEYAGGDCSCVLVSCNDVVEYEGAVIFTQPPSSGFTLTNSVIRHSAMHGITRGWHADDQSSFAATNTFDDLVGCNETRPVPLNGTCPIQPKPTCPE